MNFTSSEIALLTEYKDKSANYFVRANDPVRKSIYNKMLLETSFLDVGFETVPLKLRLYHCITNTDSIPPCLTCNNPTTYNRSKIDISNPYNKYCSSKCRSNGRQLFKDREWLYDQHITKKKSAERISIETGVSPVPIYNALKRLKITHINYTKTSSETQKYLEDKEWLSQKYITENMTCEGIASMIGSSKSTVAIWLQKHDIEPTPTNSYDRTIQRTSNKEQEIIDYIKSIYNGEVVTCNRSILKGRELDIYIPDKNLAIEFNGDYYHAINGPNKLPINYHLKKTQDCEKQGIHLLHIYESQWDVKKDIFKSIISNKLGLNNRVYARKCVYTKIDKYTAWEFLDENHVQGRNKSDIFFYGLYYEDELQCVMTFIKPRFDRGCDWELSRFCNKKGVNVIGGASKLLKKFRNRYSGSIVSYADRSYSMGGLYEVLGFEKIKSSRPRDLYMKNGIFLSRYQTRKSRLPIILENYDPDISEKSNMINNGWLVVCDSGTITYKLQ